MTTTHASTETPATGRAAHRPGAADAIAALYRERTGSALPVGLRAWDGSQAGPEVPPTVVLRSPAALRRLLWSPNELGMAQAYVTGEIDVDGDVAEGLRQVWAAVDPEAHLARPLGARAIGRMLLAACRLGAVGPRPAAPATQAKVRGRVHTKARDRAVIAHHYDLSNDFYALILDPAMAYSAGYWTSQDPDYTLADAQRDKFDLICRRLELRPGMRLLDVGCGWGGLLLHAAQHYGITGVGITLSTQQAAFARARIDERGLADRVEIRLQHFRELAEQEKESHRPRPSYDAIATVEMGEHVGATAYPDFTAALFAALAPGGRLLVQQMSRAHGAAPGGGAFIESFIAPDMHMRPLSETVALWRAAGFEIMDTESLRENYVRTLDAWIENLETRWDEAVRLVGIETARVWRLYLAGGRLAFEQERMGVEQILAAKPPAIERVGR